MSLRVNMMGRIFELSPRRSSVLKNEPACSESRAGFRSGFQCGAFNNGDRKASWNLMGRVVQSEGFYAMEDARLELKLRCVSQSAGLDETTALQRLTVLLSLIPGLERRLVFLQPAVLEGLLLNVDRAASRMVWLLRSTHPRSSKSGSTVYAAAHEQLEVITRTWCSCTTENARAAPHMCMCHVCIHSTCTRKLTVESGQRGNLDRFRPTRPYSYLNQHII
jgi:hypothetical protein